MTLEMRYRRLLAAYPAAYRAEYGDEMLGVLMSGARPGQRRPSLPDAADLLRGGLLARLGQGLPIARGAGWRDAAAVAGLLGAILLAAAPLSRLLFALGRAQAVPDAGMTAAQLAEVGARAGLWAAVIVAALAGARRTTAALAVLAALGEAASIVAWMPLDELRIIRMMWAAVLGGLVAALLIAARRGRRGTEVLGRVGTVLLLAPMIVLLPLAALVPFGAASGIAQWLTVTYVAGPLSVRILLTGVTVLVALAGLVRIPRDVRGRIAVLLAPMAVLPAATTVTDLVLGFPSATRLTAGAVAASVAIMLLLPLAAAGLTGAALRAREKAGV